MARASLTELLVPVSVAHGLVAEAREAVPRESCGLLLGAGPDEDGRLRVTRALSVPNRALASDRGRFTVAPEDLRAALDGARSELVGYYHSHVVGAPTPSDDDVAGGWPGLVAILVGPASARAPGLEAFRVEPSGSKMLWRRLRLRAPTEGG